MGGHGGGRQACPLRGALLLRPAAVGEFPSKPHVHLQPGTIKRWDATRACRCAVPASPIRGTPSQLSAACKWLHLAGCKPALYRRRSTCGATRSRRAPRRALMAPTPDPHRSGDSNLFSGTSLSASRPTRQLRATPNPLAPRPLLLPLRCWVPCGPRWAARPDSKPGAQCPAAPPWSRRPRRRTSGASCPTPACPCAWVSLVNAVAGSPRRRHRRCRCCGLGFGEALTRRHRRRPQPPRACAPSFGLVKTLARASPGGRRRSRLPLPLPLPYAGLGAVIMSNQHAHHGSEIAYPYLHSECWQRALAAAAWAPRRLRTAAAAAAAYRALAP